MTLSLCHKRISQLDAAVLLMETKVIVQMFLVLKNTERQWQNLRLYLKQVNATLLIEMTSAHRETYAALEMEKISIKL